MTKHYCYELALPEQMGGLVFYVGKGTGERINDHERDARLGVQEPRCDVIRGVWAMGFQVVKRKVFESDNAAAVLREERRRIDAYGLDRLTNKIPGVNPREGLPKVAIPSHSFHYNLPHLKSQLDRLHRRVYSWDEVATGCDLPLRKVSRILKHGSRWVETDTLGKICTYFTERGIKTTPREALAELDL